MKETYNFGEGISSGVLIQVSQLVLQEKKVNEGPDV